MLEVNSPYCYLLLAGHFADTCVIVERDGEAVGFVAAFISPAATDMVFVWQIGVAKSERGQGLGVKLLHHLLARPFCRRARRLEATVTPSNTASRALFESVARDFGVPFEIYPGLAPDLFPGSAHEREDLVRIGPLPRALRGRTPRRSEVSGQRSAHADEKIGEL